jgi:hypothetical protein
MKDICVEMNAEVVAFMYKNKRDELLNMIKDSWLKPSAMEAVFDSCRHDGGMLIHVSKMCASHPDPEVRAMGISELLAFMPIDQIWKYFWC